MPRTPKTPKTPAHILIATEKLELGREIAQNLNALGYAIELVPDIKIDINKLNQQLIQFKPDLILMDPSNRLEASQDSLTGLLNHTRILEQLEMVIARAERDKSPLSFVMIDLDHFKIINDTYGHLTGDNVIKNLAKLFKERLRKSDSIGRYGGEEFAIILPESEADKVRSIIENIKKRFFELHHDIYGKENKLNVTFSVGIASLSARCRTVNELIQAADQALYKAKSLGRNQIVVAHEGPISL